MPVCVPSPSHAGHQPSALLKEKLCGESGSKLRPQRSQAKCWLCVSTGHCGSGTSSARIGHVQHAAAQRQGVSTLPAIRERASGRTVTRSITTSTSCLRRRSIAGGWSTE